MDKKHKKSNRILESQNTPFEETLRQILRVKPDNKEKPKKENDKSD